MSYGSHMEAINRRSGVCPICGGYLKRIWRSCCDECQTKIRRTKDRLYLNPAEMRRVLSGYGKFFKPGGFEFDWGKKI